MPLDLVIFDCDGVLVDSEAIVARAESELLEAFGVRLAPEEITQRYAGLPAPEIHRRIEQEWDVTLGDPFAVEKAGRVARVLAAELEPVAGMRAVLDTLEAAGRPKRCVASSSDPERIAASLARTGLAPYFGPDVFSTALVERGKPAPDLFLLAAATMGVAPAGCLVVEDSAFGVEAAVAAGMDAVGFTAGSHSGAWAVGRLRAAGAPVTVGSAAELGALIAERLGPPPR
jgi:HAD superfamily hydrolase (TIGR01509 family)